MKARLIEMKKVSNKRRSVKCDYEKLEKVLISKDSSFSQASEDFGYARNYLRNLQLEKKELPMTIAVLLSKLYEIEKEDYEPTPPSQPKRDNNELLVSEMTGREFYALIYGAVYQANMEAYKKKREMYAYKK